MEHSLLYPHASILIRFNIQCMTIKEECHNLLNINISYIGRQGEACCGMKNARMSLPHFVRATEAL